ncbi:hypothetical protein GCM10011360_09770 [Primorskyibacter flagellatus]|uniref:Uncharacterized protein n=1 Tax=Primorskyibacter flagellatus TaxID=1387277 RepID=A0A917EDQ9_9RHOB|nr:hypothetical protein [Primorskyibacter flagellatus]GGE23279.1 hypothetical protein GCM10011360_09770 [Primorskyibacter flagellatus]
MADIYQSVPASAGRIYTPLHPVARPRGQRTSGLRPLDGVLAGVGLLAVAILLTVYAPVVTALVAGLALIGFVAWLALRSVRRGVRRRDMLRPF